MEIEGKEYRSVFVSNLDFAVTELEVKDALSSIGHCEVLLVRDFKGRSKGFGYVLFEKPVSMTNIAVIVYIISNLILFHRKWFQKH
jgi:RNA recognition motif-containing protein